MVLKKNVADHLKLLITDAVTVLCKSGLTYSAQLSVEGLLGITLDEEEVFLVNINQTVLGENEVSVGSTNTGTVVSTRGKYSCRRRPRRGITAKNEKKTGSVVAKKRPAVNEAYHHSATDSKVLSLLFQRCSQWAVKQYMASLLKLALEDLKKTLDFLAASSYPNPFN